VIAAPDPSAAGAAASTPDPGPAPAPAFGAVLALAGWELRLTLRRGENLLVTIVIPAVVLLFFATVQVLPAVAGRPVDYLLPGSLALAVIATCLVSLGIATAYERSYGVLKRLGGAPLPRGGLLAARILAVLAVEAVQVALLIAIAVVLLDWRPAPATNIPGVAAAIVLGSVAFGGLGLLLAGTLRAEATLGLANGLFLAFLLLGGMIIPLDHLPAGLAAVAAVLPASQLAEALRVGLGAAGDAGGPLVALSAWAVGLAGLAVATFRWE
jgi:ABC-2 type transport system permease protein